MFSSRKKASPRKSESTPGGIVFDASSLLTHDVSKERKFRTKVHRKTLDPVFNEVFQVRGVLGDLVAGPLLIKVLDSDALSKDDTLGTLELPLESLGAKGDDDSLEWANEPLAGAPHGTLSVRVSWAAAPKTGRHALASTPRLEQHGTLSVHVIEALNLVAADEHDPPSSDPYVKLKLSGLPKGNVLQQVRGSLFVAAGDVKQSVSVLATEGASKVETIAETVKEDVQSGAAKVAAKVRALGTVEVPMERVDEPTPDEFYFTPRDGWTKAKKAHDDHVWHRTPPGDFAPSGEGATNNAKHMPKNANGQRRLSSDGTEPHCTVEWNPPPPQLVPIAEVAPGLYHDDGKIGELWVEVLQAEYLKGGGAMDVADPYAVLVVEGYAARTSTVQNNHAPRWPSDAPRAFRFPLRRPYACLYVGLMDDDSQGIYRISQGTLARTGIDSDDPLGRVVVPLGRLASGTVYDSWYFVQYENTLRHAGSRGALRIRLSVRYPSERARLLAYVKPFPDIQPPGATGRGASAVVPFTDKAQWRAAGFAVHGKASREYDPSELKAYLVELTEVLGGPLDVLVGLKHLLFWQASVPLSVVVLIGWQGLVSYPQLVPAALCFSLAMLLQRSLALNGGRDESKGAFGREGENASAISEQPGLLALLAALLFDRSPAPLSVTPIHVQMHAEQEGGWLYDSHDGRGSDSEGDGKADQGAAAGGLKAGLLAAKARRQKKRRKKSLSFKEVLGLSEGGGGLLEAVSGGGGGALAAERKELIRKEQEDDLEEEEKAAIKEKRRSAPSLSVSTALNPMASVLGVVQPMLRDLLCALRGFERVLVWTDRRLTLWLWIGLLALSALLAVLALVVPWGLVFTCIFRLVGLLLLGPHMIWVGRWADKKQAASAAKEAAHDEADEEGRKKLLDEVRAEVKAEEDAKEEKEKAQLEKRPQWMKDKHAYLKAKDQDGKALCKYNMLMQMPKVPSQKFVGVPDPSRSRAEPVSTKGGGAVALVAPAGGAGKELL